MILPSALSSEEDQTKPVSESKALKKRLGEIMKEVKQDEEVLALHKQLKALIQSKLDAIPEVAELKEKLSSLRPAKKPKKDQLPKVKKPKKGKHGKTPEVNF